MEIRIQQDFTIVKDDSLNDFIWLGRAFPFRWLSFNWNEYNNKLTFENLNLDTLLNEYSKFYNNDILFLKKFILKQLDKYYAIVEHWSSKLNVWSWNKRWKNRKDGTGYLD